MQGEVDKISLDGKNKGKLNKSTEGGKKDMKRWNKNVGEWEESTERWKEFNKCAEGFYRLYRAFSALLRKKDTDDEESYSNGKIDKKQAIALSNFKKDLGL